ncbi:MAG: 50S ribosomal protein L1 [SAR324 cluster bacterium]|nr:50S ribosomal protein L1 [SAR324 cluster bacterium]
MAKYSKRKKDWSKEVSREQKVTLDEAIALCKKYASTTFGERLDVSIRLGIDARKSDQNVRGSVVLPHGTGKTLTVAVFAKGDKEKEALDAGADFVGGDDLAEKFAAGWSDVDRVVATPDMMAVVGKIGKLLGPKGLMPNPKTGTVTADVAHAISQIKKGQVQFRNDKGANIHCTLGLMSFEASQLVDNLTAVIETLVKLKPSNAKGTYIKGISINSTQGPGVRVDENMFR